MTNNVKPLSITKRNLPTVLLYNVNTQKAKHLNKTSEVSSI